MAWLLPSASPKNPPWLRLQLGEYSDCMVPSRAEKQTPRLPSLLTGQNLEGTSMLSFGKRLTRTHSIPPSHKPTRLGHEGPSFKLTKNAAFCSRFVGLRGHSVAFTGHSSMNQAAVMLSPTVRRRTAESRPYWMRRMTV